MTKANLELKASLPNMDSARRAALALEDVQSCGFLAQIDTYFTVKNGRLKLREIENAAGSSAEMIYFERPERSSVRLSRYEIVPVENPESLKRMIGMAVGIRGVVAKRREPILWQNSRIHLDQVDDLGSFIEFEVCSVGDDTDDRRRMRAFMDEFGIGDADTIRASYSELLGL
jgi:predicted adenylyl cyclase CyaB